MSRKIYWKEGVNPADLKIEMRQALVICDKVYSDFGKKLTITCTGDGSHCPSSFHPFGLAFDMRTHVLTEEEKKKISSKIREDFRHLHTRYTLVEESTHFHVEFTPQEK